ncbi:MAG: hypothetical protein JOZ37_05315 [Actinobacteria bacterium]|nr:hypothetical protein [Actinomycetota bacterium]MBV9936310.1 hypothetical protein [Actinomycetota bacterium]
MRHTQLVDRLHALGQDNDPGPDPAFVARLGAELHQLEQVPVLQERRPRVHHRGLGGMSWLRVLAMAVPAGAVALAAAFVALRPAPDHPRHVRTADTPGVSTPAPDVDQPSAGERNAPAATAPGGQTAPATGDGHATTRGTASAPATTTTVEPMRHLVVPAPTDQSPQTTVAPATRPEPSTSTTALTTTTTAPASLSLHCAAGTDGGSLAVTCTWSATTSSAFKGYRLSREQPDTNRVVIFTSDNRATTAYADHGVQTGANYYYLIEALDASGNVIARGATNFACC